MLLGARKREGQDVWHVIRAGARVNSALSVRRCEWEKRVRFLSRYILTNHSPILVDDSPDERDIHFLHEELYRFNAARVGIHDGRLLAIFLRDDRGILAGLSGFTWGGVLEVEVLWVREDVRGQGYGTQLLVAAEQEAIERGCVLAALDTHSFQAPVFYLRRGYQIYAELDGYPRGHSKVFLKKQLQPNGERTS